MNSPNTPFVIPDVQNFEDLREIAIDSVGIKSIRHPVRILGRDGTAQHSIASFNMYVALPQHVKGTHMSRFVELLGAGPREFSIETFGRLLIEMTDRLDAVSGHIDFSFPYFISKYAPVSAIESLLDYEVTYIGDIRQGVTGTSLRVLVPVTSLCPCSKTISERGAHNQRSHITVTVQLRETVWIEDLVTLVEREASCELYGLLKRADEKYVTERAYDNPKFVEDLVRDVAARLASDPRIGDYTVESENFESIHNHSAYARIEGKKRPAD